MNFIKTVIVILLFTATHACYATDTSSKKNSLVVLVQLRSEHNRLEAMANDKKYKEIEEAKQDVAAANAAMISDFRDHFNYCTVYYYIDTNMDLIKNKRFDGILLNANGAPAEHPAINNTSKHYLIVYYGYPTASKKSSKDSTATEANSGEPMGKGLVVNNNKFEQIAYYYKFGYDEALFGKKADKTYAYHSKHYDIDYFPFAAKFNKKLKEGKDR